VVTRTLEVIDSSDVDGSGHFKTVTRNAFDYIGSVVPLSNSADGLRVTAELCEDFDKRHRQVVERPGQPYWPPRQGTLAFCYPSPDNRLNEYVLVNAGTWTSMSSAEQAFLICHELTHAHIHATRSETRRHEVDREAILVADEYRASRLAATFVARTGRQFTRSDFAVQLRPDFDQRAIDALRNAFIPVFLYDEAQILAQVAPLLALIGQPPVSDPIWADFVARLDVCAQEAFLADLAHSDDAAIRAIGPQWARLQQHGVELGRG
jgi:hypothetical protein